MTRFAISAALGVAAAACGTAFADPANEQLVVVTAAKRPQAAAETAASVAVLAGPELAGLDDAEDVAARVPGLQAAVANGSQVAFQIRGIGAVDHQALTPSAAAVYVDGVFLATNVQTSFLTYDLERVEVLKGPQGALYGRNASSGVVSFLTATPTDDFFYDATLSLSSRDRIDAQGAISGPLTPRLKGRLAGRWRREDAPLDNVAGPKDAGGAIDEFGVRGGLAFDAGGGAEILARAHFEADDGVNPSPRNSALTLDDHQIAVGADGVRDSANRFWGGSLQVSDGHGAWDLVSLTAIEGFRQRYGFDFDGTPTRTANLSYDRDFLQLSEEVRAHRRFAWGEALIGAAVSDDDFIQDYLIWCGTLNPATLVGSCQYVGAPARVGPNPASTSRAMSLLTHIEQRRVTGAVFTSEEVALTPNLVATLGLRYAYEGVSGHGFGQHIYEDGVRALNNRSGLGAANGANRIDDDRLTGSVSLRYRVSPSNTVYVSYANGYKSGGFNGEVQNNATHFQDAGLFRAETVDALEAGLKSRPSAATSLEIAAFYEAYHDPQARIFVSFPLPGGGSIVSNSLANLDRARAFGLDLSARYAPSPTMTLGGALTVLDTEISQGSDPSGAANAQAFDGKPLPFASNVSVSLWARRTAPLPGGARLTLETEAKYVADYFLDAEGRRDRMQKGFVNWDAAARVSLANGAELTVWGKNLLNVDAAVSGYGFIGYDTFRSAPASYGVSIRLRR